jgi:long-chain acyl-CoA synthetase
MSRTIASIPRTHAAGRPQAPALIYGDRVTSWQALDKSSSRVANGLIAAGVQAGSRVGVLARNDDRFFEVFYGVAKAGGVLVSVNWRLAPPEVEFILADAGVRVLFVGADFVPLLDQIRPMLPDLVDVVVIGDDADADPYADWRSGFAAADPARDTAAGEDVMQLYTSGTTGRPKGALITHEYFFENFRLVSQVRSQFIRCQPSEAVLLTFPLFHIGGINWGFMGAVQGCPLIVMRDFDPSAVLKLLGEHRIPALPLVSAMLQAVLAAPEVESTDFSSVRYVVYGAAPMPPTLLRKAIDVIGCDFVQTYGLTESTIVTVLDADDHRLPPPPQMVSVGRPLPEVKLKLVDADGVTVPTGEVGEITIQSPVVMRGYWRQPDATSEVLEDGWFRTGDAAVLDEHGYVYLKDRVKDTIISGGENVYPAEIENALFEHPSVKDVAVVGVPDKRWGEVPKAFIVLADGAELDPDELLAHATERIARYKLPKQFEAIDVLPRTASGKVLRRELRDQSARVTAAPARV